MNAVDILKYGHLTVLATVDGLTPESWIEPGACGTWSIREIVAHLASYEQVLADLLALFVAGTPDAFRSPFDDAFNDREVALRTDREAAGVLAEYVDAYEHVADLARKIPASRWSVPGTLPWYGAEYALDDFIVYSYYGHKREHCAQIAAFRDLLQRGDRSGDARAATIG